MMWNDSHQPADSVTAISSLKTGVSGQVTAGLIIAKQDFRQVSGKNNEERGALSFTLRDSSATVNVTCWGTAQFVQQISQRFHINDVVKLSNCNVQDKPDSEQEKIYCPATNVTFKISVDQKSSKIEPLTYGIETFLTFQQKPVSDGGDFVALDKLVSAQSSYVGRFVNCLVIIKTAPNKRTIVTKADRTVTCCELEVLDNSKEVLRLVMWLESLADLVFGLIPKQTILFLTDVKVKIDSFTETLSLEATTKTIMTVNPDIPSAHALWGFAQKLPDDIIQPSIKRVSKSNASKVPLSSITKELSVEEIVESEPESGIVNAVLTSFDCSDLRRSVSKRCMGCNKKVPGLCSKAECFGKDVVPFYDFVVSLTDHTGSIDNVKLTGECAEKLIGAPVAIFEAWDSDKKGECMDRILLERYKVYFTTFSMTSGIWLQVQQVDSWVTSMQNVTTGA